MLKDSSDELRYKKDIGKLEILLLLFICVGGLWIFTPSAHAIEITPIYISDNSIEWNFSEPVKIVAIDGNIISDIMNNTLTYTAHELKANTKYTIQVTDLTNTIYQNTTYTLSTEKTSLDKIVDFIYTYWILIFTIMLLLVGIRIPLIAFIGFLVGFSGLLITLQEANFIKDLMYLILMLACFSVGYLAIKTK
jgi:hypothetical protein